MTVPDVTATSTSHKRALARGIASRLQEAGFAAFWVGGCVRDVLLGREPEDYDVATNARPEQIEARFQRTLPVGRKFGVILVLEEGIEFQVATFRAEADYEDGRRPSRVTFADARADASRRDFTVNGLFYDPVRDTLHDWVGGQADLRSCLIRTIGDPLARFGEDHLRLLRAARLAAQLDFQIEPATLAALRAQAEKIRLVSAERVRDELLKLFSPPHAARGLDLLLESGLLAPVLPEVAAFVGCAQSPEFHPEGAVYEHVRAMLGLMPPDAQPSLVWGVLLHDVGKPATATRDPASGAIHFYGHEKAGAVMARDVLERLRFPRRQIEEIVALVRQHMQFKDVRQMRKATLRRLLMRPTFPLELALHRLDCLGSNGRLEEHDFLVAQADELSRQPALRPPLLTGDDLLALGLEPGPALGALLAAVRERQLQDELRTADQAREWVRRTLAAAPPATKPPG